MILIIRKDVQALPCEPWKDFAVYHLGKYPQFWGYRHKQDGELIWTDASIVGDEFNEPDVRIERVSATLQSSNSTPCFSSPPSVGAASVPSSVTVPQNMFLPANVNVGPSPPVFQQSSNSPFAVPSQGGAQYAVQQLQPATVYVPYVPAPAQLPRPSFPVLSSSYSPPGNQSAPPMYLPGPGLSFAQALPLPSGPVVPVTPPGVTSPRSHSHHRCAHEVSNGPLPDSTEVTQSMYLAHHKKLQEKEKARQLELELELERIEQRERTRIKGSWDGRNVGSFVSRDSLRPPTSSSLSLPYEHSPTNSIVSFTTYQNADAATRMNAITTNRRSEATSVHGSAAISATYTNVRATRIPSNEIAPAINTSTQTPVMET